MIASEDRVVACAMCPESAVPASRFSTHMRVHLGYSPWACALCGVRFFSHQEGKAHFAFSELHPPGTTQSITEQLDTEQEQAIAEALERAATAASAAPVWTSHVPMSLSMSVLSPDVSISSSGTLKEELTETFIDLCAADNRPDSPAEAPPVDMPNPLFKAEEEAEPTRPRVKKLMVQKGKTPLKKRNASKNKKKDTPKRKAAKKVATLKGKSYKNLPTPKRALSAYFIFLCANRKSLTKEGMGVTDVTQEAGRLWRDMTPKDKQPWVDAAAEDKLRHQKEVAACSRR